MINNLIFMVLGKNKGGVQTYSKFLEGKYISGSIRQESSTHNKISFPSLHLTTIPHTSKKRDRGQGVGTV